MRKEGVVIIGVGLTLLVLSTNYYHIFNAITLFLLAGEIAGTKISLPASFMPLCTLIMLVSLLAWPFRELLGQKFSVAKKLINRSDAKQPEL